MFYDKGAGQLTTVKQIVDKLDIAEMLEDFDWRRPRWSEDKLIACSPFRDDHSPSFFVTLTGEYKGAWADSGATGDYAKGGFLRLWAHLNDISEDEALQELAALVGDNSDSLPTLDIKLSLPVERKTELSIDGDGDNRVTYLSRRGISSQVTRALHVTIDPNRRAICIPWFDVQGRVVALKYRSIRSKQFWYAKNGHPPKDFVYAADRAYKRRFGVVCVTEAEIDAMSVMTAGFPCVSTGGAALTMAQIDVIKGLPAHTLVLLPDDDEKGREWALKLEAAVTGYKREVTVVCGAGVDGVKDVNDYLLKFGKSALNNLISVANS